MGLIAAALNAAGGTLASQWKEYFYVDALPDNVLATKAEKKVKGRFGGSRHEDDNVISDGSVIAVADGQCMMIVDQARSWISAPSRADMSSSRTASRASSTARWTAKRPRPF